VTGQPVEPPGGRASTESSHAPVFLHLFSGRERGGSLQEQLKAFGWRTFPIDIAQPHILQAGNDLLNDQVWEEIEYMIEAGQVQGVGMDPPCSTCSRARKHPPAFPRRIRSKARPHGLIKSMLWPAEIVELQKANYMYQKVISLANMCHSRNIPWYIEQPEPWGPEDDNATLFDFPEMILLRALPGVDASDFDQCEKGADTVKPTRLVHSGLEMAKFKKNDVDGGPVRCSHPKKEWILASGGTHWGSHPPALTLAYKNKEGGEWNSKPLAEYPQEMNRLLAVAFHKSIQSS
jgi:hypothetical protein